MIFFVKLLTVALVFTCFSVETVHAIISGTKALKFDVVFFYQSVFILCISNSNKSNKHSTNEVILCLAVPNDYFCQWSHYLQQYKRRTAANPHIWQAGIKSVFVWNISEITDYSFQIIIWLKSNRGSDL